MDIYQITWVFVEKNCVTQNVELKCATEHKFCTMLINHLMSYWWCLLINWLQGFADLPPGVRISSLGRPATYDRALAWKVLAEDDSTQCIAFLFMNWSFLTWWYSKELKLQYKFWRQQIFLYGNSISGSLWLKLRSMFFKTGWDSRLTDFVFYTRMLGVLTTWSSENALLLP